MITDAIGSSLASLSKFKPSSPDEVRKQTVNLVCRSEKSQREEAELKQFLLAKMYRHYRLVRMAQKAERIITALFETYVGNPGQLPPGFKSRTEKEDVEIVVADYVAGMTDRFAGQEYKKLTDPFESI